MSATKEQVEAALDAYTDAYCSRRADKSGHVNAIKAALNAALSLSPPAEYVVVPKEPRDAQLLPFGYAPGGYMEKCSACERRKYNLDKRATLCRECAVRDYKTLVGRIGEGK